MTKQKTNPKQLQQTLIDTVGRLGKYNFIAFMIFVALIYGFVLFKIQSLKNAQPSDTSISDQVSAAKVPKINEALVKQLQSLHDNSVNVQTLFDSTRSNPFKE